MKIPGATALVVEQGAVGAPGMRGGANGGARADHVVAAVGTEARR
jgi:hypothetical protein